MQQRQAHLAASRQTVLRLPGAHAVRRRALQCNAISSPFKVKLLHPVKLSDAESRPLLVYLPGTDGTGQAILPQLPALLKAGYDVRTLYIPPEDRSGWDQLQAQVLYLLNMALADRPPGQRLTLVAESFGGCLALRIAAAAPQLVEQMVLINPATCFANSLGGLSSFVSSTNLLALFPQGAYTTAQGVLLPFLVDMGRVDPAGREALKRLILMVPPADFDTVMGTMEEDDVPTTTASRRRPASPPFSPAGSPLFAPAAAANFRANLLRTGDLPEKVLRKIPTPVLVVSSAKDRMLPSITEGARLARLLPRGRRVILPDSGHACLLERGISLARIMKTAGMLPGQQPSQQQQQQPDASPQQQQQRKGLVPAAAGGSNGNGRGPGGGMAAAAPAAAALASSSNGVGAGNSNGTGSRRITLKVPPRPPAAGLPFTPTPAASAPSSTAGAATSQAASVAGAAGAAAAVGAQEVAANNQPPQLVDAALEGVGGPSGLEFVVNVANKRAESRLGESSLGAAPTTSTSSSTDGAGGGGADAGTSPPTATSSSSSSSSSGAGPLHPDPAALQAVVQGATVMAADDIVASAAETRPSSVYTVDEGDSPVSSSDWVAAAAALSTAGGAGSRSTSSSSSSGGVGVSTQGPADRSPAAPAAASSSAAPGTTSTSSSSGVSPSGVLAAGVLKLSTAAEASNAAAAVLNATSDSQRLRTPTTTGSTSSSAQLSGTSGGSSGSSSDDEAAAASGSSSSSSKRAGSSSSSSGSKDLAWDEWSQYLAPWRDLVSPVILGLHELPDPQGKDAGRAMLFVGNHQKMGMYDMPLLLYELYMRGFKVKGLAHPGHWAGPLGPFFEQFGAVKAGPLTTHRLLRNGEQVLLFPGGAREVNKRAGEEYQLLWKDTPDFVRLAAKCDAIIVPFAAVGADDAYEVVMEVEEMLQAPLLGDFVRRSLASVSPDLKPAEAVLPITRLPGLGLPTPFPVPNLQRLYFKICTPLDTRELKQQRRLGRSKDDEAWQELYQDVKGRVELGMQELLALRELDDERFVGARLGKAISSWLPAMNLAQEQPSEPTSSSTSGQ